MFDHLDADQITRLLASLDVGVIASLGSEGSSRILLEFMSSAVPVVATRVGGIPDIGQGSPESVVLVNPGNPRVLARKMLDWVEAGPERRRKCGEESRQCILQHHSPRPWATQMVERLNSYTEVSPSGKGLHVLCRGSLPDGRRRGTVANAPAGAQVEMYDRSRFFTVTGHHLDGTPKAVRERGAVLEEIHASLMPASSRPPQTESGPGALSDAQLIERAKRARNGKAFGALWSGDWEGRYRSSGGRSPGWVSWRILARSRYPANTSALMSPPPMT